MNILINCGLSLISQAAEGGATEPPDMTLNPLGWTFMLVSLAFVVGLTLWCFARVLSLPIDPAEEADQ